MRSYCRICERDTNHKIISEEIVDFEDEGSEVFGQDKYQIIRCMGCNNVAFREEGWFSEDINPYTGQPMLRIVLYPKASGDDLQLKRMMEVPHKIRRIYEETIGSYNNQNFILCATGLRAIIEGVCAEENIKDGPVKSVKNKKGNVEIFRKENLQGKIGGLYERNLITESHAEILHEHRFLGNKAVHELDMPSAEELKLGIEILEHTLENIYELKYKGGELQYKRELRKMKALKK